MANRTELTRIWAATGDRTDPGLEKYRIGWEAEIPTFQVLNELQYRHDVSRLAHAERGVYEWGSDVDYRIGSFCWDDTTDYAYIAVVANPSKTLKPSENPSQWVRSAAQLTLAEWETARDTLNNHIASLNNPHGVTAAQAGTYTRAQVDALIADLDGDLGSHVDRVDNPHSVTAAQVNALPLTGGTVAGPITFTSEDTFFNPNAGDFKARANASGFRLVLSSQYSLGLDASGTPVFGDGVVDHELIHGLTFPDFRVEEEADFAIPTPDLELRPLSDYTLYQGAGAVTFTAPTGRTYTDKSGAAQTAGANVGRFTVDGLLIDPAATEVFNVDADLNLSGYVDYTISLDGHYTAGTGIILTTGADTISITATEVSMTYNGTAYTLGAAPSAGELRITVVKDDATLRGVVNGVPFEHIITPRTETYAKINFSAGCALHWKQFRTWNKPLSNRQISNL